ncbi:hypothetical protein PMIN04_012932 [Paraphaeosphaeria minitans]|uniref:Uncharacterized protein n=1 Tax=Paraphaeosphaeria minitans TaxID=565426 RepID=A0A9P6KKH9_9PLEO|nr:hypothetical protein PMIN01_11738 [Paraphaeosphaeria minitans]
MSSVMPAREYLGYLPLGDIRRMFLEELAYMCEYDKGGETVAALGLRHRKVHNASGFESWFEDKGCRLPGLTVDQSLAHWSRSKHPTTRSGGGIAVHLFCSSKDKDIQKPPEA